MVPMPGSLLFPGDPIPLPFFKDNTDRDLKLLLKIFSLRILFTFSDRRSSSIIFFLNKSKIIIILRILSKEENFLRI